MDALKKGISSILSWLGSCASKHAAVAARFSLTSDIVRLENNIDGFETTVLIKGSTFADSISSNDISLEGGFLGMQIQSVKRISDTVAKIKASGKTYCDGAGNAQGKGFIIFKPQAINNSNSCAGCEIPLCTPSLDYNQSKFQFDTGKLSVLLVLKDCSFAQTVNANSFCISNSQTALDFEKISDTRGVLTLATVEKDLNTAALAVSGTRITLKKGASTASGDVSTLITVFQAKVYANIDYVEKTDEEKLKVTIPLEIVGGSFNGLTADKISLGGDLAKAENIVLNNSGLTFAIPASGPIEALKLTGTIKIDGDSIVNSLGIHTEDQTIKITYEAKEVTRDLDIPEPVSWLLKMGGSYVLKQIGQELGIYDAETATENTVKYIKDEIESVSLNIETVKMDVKDILNKVDQTAARNALDKVQDILTPLEESNSKLRRYVNDILTAMQKQKGSMDNDRMNNQDEYNKLTSDFLFACRDLQLSGGYSAMTTRLGQKIVPSLIPDESDEDADKIYETLLSTKYNFNTETIELRRRLRAYIAKTYLNSYVISMLQMKLEEQQDHELDNTENIAMLKKQLSSINDRLKNKKIKADENNIYCYVTKQSYAKKLIPSYITRFYMSGGEITYEEFNANWTTAITKEDMDTIISRLAKDKTLKQLFTEAGFIPDNSFASLNYFLPSKVNAMSAVSDNTGVFERTMYAYADGIYDMNTSDKTAMLKNHLMIRKRVASVFTQLSYNSSDYRDVAWYYKFDNMVVPKV
jgi:hypothetical protein